MVVRLAEVVAQKDIFGGNGGVGLKLEHPVAVAGLAPQQGARRPLDEGVDRVGAEICGRRRRIQIVHSRLLHFGRAAGQIRCGEPGADRPLKGRR
jgi:hypothetical protein